ncbi:MAG: hypothetical protein ACRD1Y_02885 [Terriglobales bacterium]
MEQTLHQLVNLLFGSIPTILLFIALHYYLKWALYRPLQRTLDQRSGRIEGRKAAARQLLQTAEQKLAGYELSLRQRHLDNFKLIEAQRLGGMALGQSHIAAARQEAVRTMVEARQHLAEQNTEAHRQLRATAERLAQQIVVQVLRGQPEMEHPAPGVGV